MFCNTLTVTAPSSFAYTGDLEAPLSHRVFDTADKKSSGIRDHSRRLSQFSTARQGLKKSVERFCPPSVFVQPTDEAKVDANPDSLWEHPLVQRVFADLERDIHAGTMDHFKPAKPIRSIHNYEIPVWQHIETGVRVIEKYHELRGERGVQRISGFIDAMKSGCIDGRGIVPMVLGPKGRSQFFELDLRGLGRGTESPGFDRFALQARLEGRELRKALDNGDVTFAEIFPLALEVLQSLGQDWVHGHLHDRNWIVHRAPRGHGLLLTLIDFTKIQPRLPQTHGTLAKLWCTAQDLARDGQGIAPMKDKYYYFSHFQGVKFDEMITIFFDWCHLAGADFSGQRVHNPHFRYCILDGTNFDKAKITRGYFVGASSFEGASFRGTSFWRTTVSARFLAYLATFLDNLYVYTLSHDDDVFEVTTEDRLPEIMEHFRENFKPYRPVP